MDDPVFGVAGEKKRDTKILELVAEHFVAHSLGRHGILCAKPYFDQNGADLLGMLNVDRMALYCRIQCKGRTLKEDDRSVEIPCKYVDSHFVAFLFIEDQCFTDSKLYCFFEDEIKNWNEGMAKKVPVYRLSLKKDTFETDLEPYKFSDKKAEEIKFVITTVDLDQAKHYCDMLMKWAGHLDYKPHNPADWKTNPLTGELMTPNLPAPELED